MRPGDRLASSVRLTLQTSAHEPVSVELAPRWWLDENGAHFSTGSRVKVIGASKQQRTNEIVAWEVRTGNRSLRLRDSKGQPVWRTPASE